MAIANVALSDTFDTWRIRTNEIAIVVNENDTALDASFLKGNTAHLVANTAYDKANSANYYTYLVDANTQAAFETANIAIANVNYVNTFAQLLALDSNNATVLIAVPGYNKANSANYYAYLVDGNTQAAFLQSNTAYTVANNAYDKANSANYFSFLVNANTTASFAKGNAAHLTANTSYDKANSANYFSFLVNANTTAAFLQANTAYTVANAAYGRANVAFSNFTAANILSNLLTVDGAGTGLDADLLDGQQGSYYLPATSYSASDVLSKLATVDGSGSGLDADLLDGQQGSYYSPLTTAQAAQTTASAAFARANSSLLSSSYTASDVLSKLTTVDGSGSGLDADLLDGQQGAYYQPASSAITTTNIGSQSVNYAASAGNADTVDGYHASAFARYAAAAQFTGRVTGIAQSSGDVGVIGYSVGTSYYGYIGYDSYSFYGNSTMYSGGQILCASNITAYYSDKRLKTNITPISKPLELISQINGVYFTENDLAKSFGYDNDEVQIGVLAQEVQKVIPNAVTLAPFDIEMVDGKTTSKSGENYLTVKYEKLVPLLIEAIKELKNEVDELRAKLENK